MKSVLFCLLTLSFLNVFQQVSLGADLKSLIVGGTVLYVASEYEIRNVLLDGKEFNLLRTRLSSNEVLPTIKKLMKIKHKGIVPIDPKSLDYSKGGRAEMCLLYKTAGLESLSSFFEKNKSVGIDILLKLFSQFLDTMQKFTDEKYCPGAFVPYVRYDESKSSNIAISAWIDSYQCDTSNIYGYKPFAPDASWGISGMGGVGIYSIEQRNASIALTFAFALFSREGVNYLTPGVLSSGIFNVSKLYHSQVVKIPGKIYDYLYKQLSLDVKDESRHDLAQIREWFEDYAEELKKLTL